MSFFQIICGVLVGVLLAIKLKGLGSPFWVYISVGLSIFVLFYIINRLSFVMDFLDDVMTDIGLESGYFEILIKIVGISPSGMTTSVSGSETGLPPQAHVHASRRKTKSRAAADLNVFFIMRSILSKF